MSQTFVVKFIQVPREKNKRVDQLAKVAFAEHMMVSRQVLSFIQQSPTIEELEI